MRQSDVIDRVRDIILEISVDASPENYELCHRYVTRSDPAVVSAFEQALAIATPINAAAFQQIMDGAGPPRGQIDVARHMAQLDAQLATILGATSHAIEDAAGYSRSLSAGAEDLRSLDLGANAAALLADLETRTIAMAERAASLEANLHAASSELSALRGDLARAQHESGSDALTSLPNRRAFDSRLDDAIAVAQASRRPLSLAFCDVDHFKTFNDTWGHKLGDQVLRFVGSQMASLFGEIGLPARFGGEEFVVLLPNHGSADALEVVRRFCEAVSARILRQRSDGREIGRVTLSAGVATLRRGETATDFVERADATMYAAKQAGRNRVHVSS
jgi:diguanylate cyclase